MYPSNLDAPGSGSRTIADICTHDGGADIRDHGHRPAGVWWRLITWVMARAAPRMARAARARKVTASAWADTWRNALRAWPGGAPGRRPARFRYRVPNVATPTSRPSWFTVTTPPVASAASSTGTLISTRVISGLNAAAIQAPVMAPIR